MPWTTASAIALGIVAAKIVLCVLALAGLKCGCLP